RQEGGFVHTQAPGRNPASAREASARALHPGRAPAGTPRARARAQLASPPEPAGFALGLLADPAGRPHRRLGRARREHEAWGPRWQVFRRRRRAPLAYSLDFGPTPEPEGRAETEADSQTGGGAFRGDERVHRARARRVRRRQQDAISRTSKPESGPLAGSVEKSGWRGEAPWL